MPASLPSRSPLIALLALSVWGCGGGGGSSTPPPANLSSAPGESAVNAYAQSSSTIALSTTYNGNSFTINGTLVPNSGTVSFDGQSAITATRTSTISENGSVVATSISTDYFLLNPFDPLGNVENTGTPYEIQTGFTQLPTTFTVGQSGTLATYTLYHDSTMAAVDAMETDTWTVSAYSASAVQVCMISTISGVTAQGTTDQEAAQTESDCYADTAAGSFTLVSITVTSNGTTLTFK